MAPGTDAHPVPATLSFDGAAKDTTGGPIGAGYVLELDGGGHLSDSISFAYEGTNNVAEWEALLAGLRAAVEAGVDRLQVYGDSELVIRQMKGRYDVNEEHLQPLHDEAKELLRAFKAVDFEHVPREENERADELATEGAERSGDQDLEPWEERKQELESRTGSDQSTLGAF